MLTHGIGDRLKCPECQKEISSKSNLRTHIKSVHEQSRDYICNYCDKTFKTSSSLQAHTERFHEEKRFKCDESLKMFGSKLDLKKL